MESEKIKCLYADKNLGTTVSRNKALKLKNADEVLQYSARNLPSKKEKFYKVLPFKSAKINALQLEHVDYNLMPDFSV